jgi:WD40 repeat protein/GTPase SAR1 family protein
MATDEKMPGLNLRHRLQPRQISPTSEPTQVAWSPDGQMLAVCFSDRERDSPFAVWDLTERPGPGVRTGTGSANRAAWSPDGATIVTAMYGGHIQAWSADDLSSIGHALTARATWLAWSPDGSVLACGENNGTISYWNPDFSMYPGTIEAGSAASPIEHVLYQVAWRPDGQMLASGSGDGIVQLWTWPQRKQYAKLSGHTKRVLSLAWSPDGRFLVSASDDNTLRVWDLSKKDPRILEGHTGPAIAVAFSPCGRILASSSNIDGIRLWRCDTWMPLAHIPESISYWTGGIAFHPERPLLAVNSEDEIHIWELDPEVLLGAIPIDSSVLYTTAKIVLVGDSGVGKTGLGWRLAHGEFKEQASTHGQQFWMLDSLHTTRGGGTECEAVLWDLAGQPDYRLLHALFLDDAALALVLFDPTDRAEPLRGTDYWLKALTRRLGGLCPTILVGARIDRGQPTLTEDQILAYCADRGVSGGYLSTSAFSGDGLDDLITRMRDQVEWDQIAPTVTTTTFKRIKNLTLNLKEGDQVLISPSELRRTLEDSDPDWVFTDDELITAVGHLARHGYVQLLRTAGGEQRILLRPDLLNRLASSVVLEARRNPKGLGAVDEALLREDHYHFAELEGLTADERDIMLDATVVLFVEHNLCFRESVGSQGLLIFPELINRKRPPTEGPDLVDDVSYTIQGAVANVYAALVVLLGYTNTFTRTQQWRAQAQYDVSGGETCGFRQVGEREGEIDIVLSYGSTTSPPTRLIFQGLFERILLGRQVTAIRYPPFDCPQCRYRQERSEVVRRTNERRGFLFCSNCGTRTVIPPAESLGLGSADAAVVSEQAATAAQRTIYETALTKVIGFVRSWENKPKQLFISYAWGVVKDERWVEKRLAWDLRHAGIDVVLDRWDNAQPGANIARFISRISESDLVVVVGTPLYRDKYENHVSTMGSVVAAEIDLIEQRLLGTEQQKQTVLPVLLDGTNRTSLPPLLMGRIYVDFRSEDSYFASLFDLILAVHGVPFDDEAVIELRQSLRDRFHGQA